MTLVLSVLAASLLGSLHCAAMCGGFACLYAGAGPTRNVGAVGRHAAYHGARLAGYLVLGVVAGGIGGAADATIAIGLPVRTAAAGAGVLMVAWGAARLAAELGLRVGSTRGFPGLEARLVRLMAATDRGPRARAAVIGLVTALLPCGWLYTFVVTAAGTGSWASGALVMAVFWTGTLPALATVAIGVQRAAGPLRRRLPAFSAAVLVALGALSLGGRLQVGPAAHPSAHEASAHDHP